MIALRVAAALGDAVALVTAEAGRTVDMVIAEVRAAGTKNRESVLLLIPAGVPALDRAMLRAAVGPLAVALAPVARLNALDLAGGASVDDVVAAALFLTSAASTTGQLVEIAPRD